MLFVVSAVLFDMLKARQLACVSKSGQKCPAALSLSSWRAWIEISRLLPAIRTRRSLSSWRAWIEILLKNLRLSGKICRSPHGERGLKWEFLIACHLESACRSPHGERGLKYRQRARVRRECGSLSSWRAWIEMRNHASQVFGRFKSLSSWRAWIEISRILELLGCMRVALLMESVD